MADRGFDIESDMPNGISLNIPPGLPDWLFSSQISQIWLFILVAGFRIVFLHFFGFKFTAYLKDRITQYIFCPIIFSYFLANKNSCRLCVRRRPPSCNYKYENQIIKLHANKCHFNKFAFSKRDNCIVLVFR